MINLLLLNNFYRFDEFKTKATNLLYTVSVTRYGPQSVVVNLLRWNDVPRTSRVLFVRKLQYFLSFKCIQV